MPNKEWPKEVENAISTLETLRDRGIFMRPSDIDDTLDVAMSSIERARGDE